MEKFKHDIITVCRKHNMYISHEDDHGGFLIVEGNKEPQHIDHYIKWFLDAEYAR